uniref:EF-hand domain-containing protein n=1 Tax=uncultured Thiotrichaceae bacterium TaxID=298394 RepID=A0A6S6TVG2_9GAMM|nr:MAG: Unknown protein [uncultured Thiotrichaceae bacterium]
MDISNIMQNGAQAFQSKLDADGDGQIEVSDLVPALTDLFTNIKGDMDISSILSGLNAGGLTSVAQSWLGDGENEAIDGEQVTSLLGMDTISSFAGKLGVQVEQAVGGLQEALPGIIDQASSGAESLADIAGDLFEGDTSSAEALLGDAADTITGAASTVTAAVGDIIQGDDKTA